MTKNSSDLFQQSLLNVAALVEAKLYDLLGETLLSDEIARPDMFMKAMRHGALNGGKRLRPFLVMEVAKMFGGDEDAALYVGAALECLHSYSLVHDDLPAMDDDDLRRGKPTVHKAYDEATAILVGDGLLTMAFDILSSDQFELPAFLRVQLMSKLARASGVGGMVGGQVLDIEAETKRLDEDGILLMQSMKTGALIRFACEAGAILSDAESRDIAHMRKFGILIGQAFQLADDILDVTADRDVMGKATGKDEARGKETLIGIYGLDGARQKLDQLVEDAILVLKQTGRDSQILVETAKFIANRTH